MARRRVWPVAFLSLAGLGVGAWLVVRSLAPAGGVPQEAGASAGAGPVSADATKPVALDEGALKAEQRAVAAALVDAYPDDPEAVLLLALICRKQADVAAARKCLERCLELSPNFAPAYNHLGWLLIDVREYEKALEVFRKGVDRVPEAACLRFGAGRTLMDLGRHAEAVEAFQKAVELDPRASEYDSALGEAYLKLKDFERARKAGEAALAAQPVFNRAYWVLASAYAGLGEEDKAQACRSKFGDLDKQDREGERLWRLEHSDAALAAGNAAFTHTDIGRIYLRHGAADKARDLWRRAGELAPSYLVSRVELAKLSLDTGQAAPALAVCEEIIRIDTTSALGYLYKGHALAALNRPDEAEKAFRKAIDLAPGRAEGYSALAMFYLKAGREPTEAKLLALTAVRLEPSAAHLSVLGQACARNGDKAGAQAALERARKLDPRDPQVQKAYEALQENR